MSNVGGSVARWRTVDIVVAAVLAVAFGVVFQVANGLWSVTEGAFKFFPPAQAVLYGLWILPAVLAPMIVRKAGAALFTETLASAVSVLLGSPYGAIVIVQGAVEGLGAELGIAAGGYRRFGIGVALLSGALGGAAATTWDVFYSYASWSVSWKLGYIACAAVACAVVAGLGALLLTKALAQTGVLDRFPSGRERASV
ncbi:ECF transporter S component [Phytomonospora sp. NPDC050363]|uniref:ECF transporter S component n=1 Tax=Phytomonospora sp. NPDC050363 TaxID=3155642 RepID=UPI00341177B4